MQTISANVRQKLLEDESKKQPWVSHLLGGLKKQFKYMQGRRYQDRQVIMW